MPYRASSPLTPDETPQLKTLRVQSWRVPRSRCDLFRLARP
jgi:hypothetical protein